MTTLEGGIHFLGHRIGSMTFTMSLDTSDLEEEVERVLERATPTMVGAVIEDRDEEGNVIQTRTYAAPLTKIDEGSSDHAKDVTPTLIGDGE